MHKKLCLVVLLAAFISSSCSSFPTSGPVVEGKPGLSDNETIVLRASGPVRGSTPEQLLRDFKQACNAGPFEDFSTARLYLSERRAKNWSPRTKQIVLSEKDGYSIERMKPADQKDGEPVFRATGDVVLTLDKFGRQLPAATKYTAEFKMAKEKGEWRITDLPNEVALSLLSFQHAYSRRDLYFVSASEDVMFADPRWLPRENIPRRIVEAIIAGPSVALAPGLKPGMNLKDLRISQVDIKNNEVQIIITQDSSLPDAATLSLLKKQLLDSLSALIGSSEITFYYRNKPLEVALPAANSTDYKKRAVGLRDGSLVVQELGPNSAVASEEHYLDKKQVLNYSLSWPAIGMSPDSPLVALGGDDSLLLINKNLRPVTIFVAPHLRKPIVDRFNWIWTGSSDDVNILKAFHTGRGAVEIPVEGLAEGSKILETRVDSSGVLMVASVLKGSNYFLYQMVVSRSRDGKPLKISVVSKVAEFKNPISSLAWINASSYAVLLKSDKNTLIHYSINSFSEEKEAPPGDLYLINNPPEETIQVLNSNSERQELQRKHWLELSHGLQYLSYSG